MHTDAKANQADATYYGALLPVFIATEKILLQALSEKEQSCRASGERFPIEHYKARIKSAESTRRKLKRLGLPEDSASASENLYDLVGVRIVCQFIDDIYRAFEDIATESGFEVFQVKDYIKHPKENGYRSLHVIMRVPIGDTGPSQFAEVQIRTIAMDFWASLEHEVKYKKDIPGAALMFVELKRCADEIAAVDLSMQAIYDWVKNSAALRGGVPDEIVVSGR